MMRILGTSRFCQLALVAVAVAAMAGSDAMAWSYGSWGSSGSYGSYGSGGSYGSYGGGLFARGQARRAARRAARASYGSYGSAGSYGSYGGYAAYSSHGSYGGVSYSAPVQVVDDCVGCVGSTTTTIESVASTGGSASIAVTLPTDAKVYVNQQLTTSTGSTRNYLSRGLVAGKSYTYKLRVEFVQDGQKVVEHKVLQLQAGDDISLSFDTGDQAQLASASGSAAETELKIEVPENARVFLAGAATKQTGATRSFVTKQLAFGDSWDGYTIRVTLEQGGRELIQERTLTVEGGQSYELAFDFDVEDEMKLAQLDK